jgi:hypothetical protein
MKKAYRHDELSDKVCCVPGCETKLKKRLVEAKPHTHRKCYRHYKEARNSGFNRRKATF